MRATAILALSCRGLPPAAIAAHQMMERTMGQRSFCARTHEVAVRLVEKGRDGFRAAMQESKEAETGRMKRLKLKKAAKPKRQSLHMSLPKPAAS